jgi:acyl-CoA synthetase (AMP-forming)/AMP-acid ligase II
VTPTDLTIPALLARRVREDAGVQALVSDDASITYAGVDDESRTLAARLVAAGIGKGDPVGLVMPNGIDWAVASLAVLRIGAVLVPLSTLLRPPELIAQLRTASVSHLVTVSSYRGRSYLEELMSAAPGWRERTTEHTRVEAVPSLRAAWVWDDLPDRPAPASLVDAMQARVRPADDLAIIFTSGSRGAPKGVIHTHGSALRSTAAGLDTRQVRRGDRLYIPMPFFWVGGFGTGLLSVLLTGATLLTEATPEPARTLRFLERERVTLFRGWPEQAARIAADPAFASTDLSSLRPASLGAVLPPELRAAPGARANLFGMTESFGPYCGARLDVDLPSGKHGSCGLPFVGVEIRVVEVDSRADVEPGTQGEIMLRGPNMMRGICGRVRSELFDADGWYATGDMGALDEDGYLWFTGRVDDLFKVKGATVAPTEVEAALRTIPGIRQAFVTDVPDGTGAAQVGAVVVAPEGSRPADIFRAARDRLSSFKIPTRWVLVPDAGAVPMLATGKIDKPGLQRLIMDAGVSARAADTT